jgi:hypothetical protein
VWADVGILRGKQMDITDMVETNCLRTGKQQLIVDHLNPREGVCHARHTRGTHLNPRQGVCHARHTRNIQWRLVLIYVECLPFLRGCTT